MLANFAPRAEYCVACYTNIVDINDKYSLSLTSGMWWRLLKVTIHGATARQRRSFFAPFFKHKPNGTVQQQFISHSYQTRSS